MKSILVVSKEQEVFRTVQGCFREGHRVDQASTKMRRSKYSGKGAPILSLLICKFFENHRLITDIGQR